MPTQRTEATAGGGKPASLKTGRLAATLIASTVCAGNPATAASPLDVAVVRATASAFAEDRYEGDWAYRIRPWKREPAVAVTVVASGLGDDKRDTADELQPCTGRNVSMTLRHPAS